MGLLLLAQSIVAYYAGRFSDIFGRKILLILEGYSHAIVVLLFLFLIETWQLYVLQIIIGVLAGLEASAGMSFLGDITRKQTRGRDIGKYFMIVGIISSLTMMIGGYIVVAVGIKFIFIAMAVANIISSSLLLKIKENKLFFTANKALK